ncbi:MAG: AraC family transcriptional regulator [Lachnospiraceae bacterium]|nr:AraC family transcriptional regulator [Lachnospiraceae bacterium]
MDWLVSFRKAIDYMEEHLLEDIGANEVADVVHISAFYFQRSFKIVTGYSIGEYMRNRRLYLAGLDVLKKADRECRQPLDEKIIDLAYKYGYDTPESFTKAFSRFHSLSPMQLRTQPHRIKVFLPLIIEISIRGGNKMEFTI